MMRTLRAVLAAVLMAAVAPSAGADEPGAGLRTGDPDLKSAGALAFGPDGILFVGDGQGGAIFALDTGDRSAPAEKPAIEVDGLTGTIAGMLGTEPREVLINDLAINPISGRAYLSVSRGRGPEADPVIVRVDAPGELTALELVEIPFARAELPGLPDPAATDSRGRSPRSQAITDLIYSDGRVLVAGLSNEEFSSRLLAIPYPFTTAGDSASVEIYHGAHGRFETRSPIRTFLACELQGRPHVLAAYTCTPLVKIPAEQLRAGAHVKGTTIAELGNRNNPLDMIAYQDAGKDFLLIANSSRGVMKVPVTGADSAEGITEPVAGTAGLTYETIAGLEGVAQLDKLDDSRGVILVQGEDGTSALKTIELP